MTLDPTTAKATAVLIAAVIGNKDMGIEGASAAMLLQAMEDANSLAINAERMKKAQENYTGDKDTTPIAPEKPDTDPAHRTIYVRWAIIKRLEELVKKLEGKKPEEQTAINGDIGLWNAEQNVAEATKDNVIGQYKSMESSQQQALRQGQENLNGLASLAENLLALIRDNRMQAY